MRILAVWIQSQPCCAVDYGYPQNVREKNKYVVFLFIEKGVDLSEKIYTPYTCKMISY